MWLETVIIAEVRHATVHDGDAPADCKGKDAAVCQRMNCESSLEVEVGSRAMLMAETHKLQKMSDCSSPPRQ